MKGIIWILQRQKKKKKKKNVKNLDDMHYKISNADDKIRMDGFGFGLLKFKYFGMFKKIV